MTSVTHTDPLAGIRIIDCDSHFTEPPDLWTSRASEALQARVPVHRTIDGVTAWFMEDELWASTGGNTIRRGHEKVLGTGRIQPFDDMDPAAWNVKDRLGLLDEIGIHAQILYPNGVGFSSNHIFAIDDLDLRAAVLQMYNDFYVELQAESDGRLFPQALLPVWDMDLTIREMSRMLDAGITGFTLSDKPEMIGLPELPEPYFEPMWDVFNQSGAVANFHIGAGARREEMEAIRAGAVEPPFDPNAPLPAASTTPPLVAPAAWRTFGPQRRLAVQVTQMFMSNVRIVANLCMSNLFDRFENLKIVSAESGIGWVPYILETLEHQFDQMVTRPEEVGFAKHRPSEYFRNHIYAMFWFEDVGVKQLLDHVGVRNVLVETDIPHPTCLYPGTRERFASVMSGFDFETRLRVLQDNAAELYGIPLPVQVA